LRNYSGPSVEDLMLLARQQIREAPIILARWSRNPPVTSGDLVRFQQKMRKNEADKQARLESEKRREADKLKQRISVNDYKNRKYTPKPLSKLPHNERRHQEAHMSSRREHKSSAEASVANGAPEAPIAPISGSKRVPSPTLEDIGQAVNQRLVTDEDIQLAKNVCAQIEQNKKSAAETPKEDVGGGMDDEPASYTPPGNSPDSPEPVAAKTDAAFDLASIVKTGSSFLSASQSRPSEISGLPIHLSLDDRLRQHSNILHGQFDKMGSPVPQPVPVSFIKIQ